MQVVVGVVAVRRRGPVAVCVVAKGQPDDDGSARRPAWCVMEAPHKQLAQEELRRPRRPRASADGQTQGEGRMDRKLCQASLPMGSLCIAILDGGYHW